MTPFFFGDSGSPLWGVLHAPPPEADRAHGVIVCPPIGHEHVRSHWALRQIASKLAEQGFHVLRFDWFGVGDSAGELVQASIERWRTDALLAAEELRDATGHKRVSALGVRFGAAIAMLVAREAELDTLVLWDPVCDGDAYLRLLRSLHQRALHDEKRFWAGSARERARTGEQVLVGQRFSDGLCDDIAKVTPERLKDAAGARLVCVRSGRGSAGAEGEIAPWARSVEQHTSSTDAAWEDPHKVDELFLPGEATTVVPACFREAR